MERFKEKTSAEVYEALHLHIQQLQTNSNQPPPTCHVVHPLVYEGLKQYLGSQGVPINEEQLSINE